MKAFSKWALLAGLLLAPATAKAQVYGQFTGAETVPPGGHEFGAYVNASQNLLGLVSQLRLSFYPNIDFGFHGGLNRISIGTKDRTTLRVGGDVKFVVSKGGAVDVSAGGALGVETGDAISVLTVGPSVVVSRTFTIGNGGFTPYGGAAILFSNIDISDKQDTDFSIPFRFGSEFKLSPEIKLVAEIQLRANDEINDDFAFVTGVNLPF